MTCVEEAGVDGCGVSVLSAEGSPLPLHATNRVAARIEDLQFTLGEGPCLDASATGSPVLVANLDDPAEGIGGRWPMFLGEATTAGVAAVFAFPVRIGAIALGVLDLYRAAPGPLDNTQMKRTFATVETLGRQMLDLGRTDGDDPGAAYPMTVHQAAGMVTVQLGTSIEDALVRLRATAFAEGRQVSELAADIVSGRRNLGKENT